MNTDANVAVVILTFNEAKHLTRALRHVRGFAREIFVIDSFSTDDTVELAKAGGATVLQHTFEYQAQQFAWPLEHVPITADWVMRLDADEIIETDLAEEIVTKLPTLPPDVTGIKLNHKTIFQGKFLRFGGGYPLTLLRIWRRGKARIENRWMNEHMCLTEGRSITFKGGFADRNLDDVKSFIAKRNGYATREALDVLSRRLNLFDPQVDPTRVSTVKQAKIKRFFKESVYNRLPFEISATLYFLFGYVIQLGFLDGRQGLVYHVLQGFWYRFLVGAKLREMELAVKEATTEDEKRSVIAHFTLKSRTHFTNGNLL